MASPPTRQQIAMFGHVAAALRAVMAAKGWTPGDLNAAIGRPRSNTGAYQWLNGKAAPGPGFRPKLSKATGIPEAELMPRKPGDSVPALAPRQAVTAAGTVIPPKRVGDVLLFTVTADGEARIKLDIQLPLATATPLLRMLLDAGIVFGETP